MKEPLGISEKIAWGVLIGSFTVPLAFFAVEGIMRNIDSCDPRSFEGYGPDSGYSITHIIYNDDAREHCIRDHPIIWHFWQRHLDKVPQ